MGQKRIYFFLFKESAESLSNVKHLRILTFTLWRDNENLNPYLFYRFSDLFAFVRYIMFNAGRTIFTQVTLRLGQLREQIFERSFV